jgi:voltage-gated potassium channel
VNEFVARHEVAWELGFAILAVAFVIVGVLEDQATGVQGQRLTILDLALNLVFLAEFSIRLWASADRRRYVRGHWIDAFALIPTIRGLRLVRLVRLLRLARAFAGIFRALESVERVAQHRGLALLFLAWLAVMVICSAGLYLAEKDVNTNIQTLEDALWWGVTTLTTVGYGDKVPVTTEGRLAAGVLMVLGITLWAGITATITSSLLDRRRGGDDREPDPTPGPAEEGHVLQLIRLRDARVLSEEEFSAGVSRVAVMLGHGEASP